MPFITSNRRKIMDLPEKDRPADFVPQPGDLCYQYYKPMVEAWRTEPRWTTVHRLHREMKDELMRLNLRSEPYVADWMTAYELAWQCFFTKYVWLYELEKIKLNGDIDG